MVIMIIVVIMVVQEMFPNDVDSDNDNGCK
jgi:hypothetical protein